MFHLKQSREILIFTILPKNFSLAAVNRPVRATGYFSKGE